MDELTKTVVQRGDLAHLALFLWATGASTLLVWSLREMARVNQHFNDFVREIATLNQLLRRETKPMANKTSRDTAQQTFRQFAWNLAGTLASSKAGSRPAPKPGGKR